MSTELDSGVATMAAALGCCAGVACVSTATYIVVVGLTFAINPGRLSTLKLTPIFDRC